MENTLTVEMTREVGKALFFSKDANQESKDQGLKMLIEADKKRDPEAMFIVARLILDGVLTIGVADQVEYALSRICNAANDGCIQARVFLNEYCEKRYEAEYGARIPDSGNGKLVDFDGKTIKVDRQGAFTPVDAVLEYIDGKNILTLKANVVFVDFDEIKEPEKYEQAIIEGIMEWEGDYEVFGGQSLTVRVELTRESRLFDNIYVIGVTNSLQDSVHRMGAFMTTDYQKELDSLIDSKRSFAVNGFKWKATSRKLIYIQSENGLFDDYEEIKNVAKHEFGHALGLGDLYRSPTDNLKGVEKGTFAELDSYAITNKYYNLVMCDHHGPISNNDIEMVVLAFRENKMQLYQVQKTKGKIAISMGEISDALGKGN